LNAGLSGFKCKPLQLGRSLPSIAEIEAELADDSILMMQEPIIDDESSE